MKKPGVYKLRYDPRVRRDDIPRLDKTVSRRIQSSIEVKLTTNPEVYGEPLRGSLKPKWKLRVGDWRVIYTIANKEIYIHLIGHRSDVYKEARGR